MPTRPDSPAVMLASPTKQTPAELIKQLEDQGTWWFEVKFDGIRAVITRTGDGSVIITNRRQIDITHRYPDVVQRFAGMDFVGILDGEIICVDAKGRPDFERAHRRDAQSSPSAIRRLSVQYPATFVPFDVLQIAGKDVRAEAYTARRMRLATVFSGERDVWSLSAQDGTAMWDVVQSWNLEGLVAKLGSSAYVPGRSPAWLKIKATKRISVLINGFEAGKGSRAGQIGALLMFLWNPDGFLVPVGKVGSGFSDADLRLIRRKIDAGEHLVVDVEYLEVSSAGQLRNPVFKGLRQDVPITECTIDTLQ